MFTEPYVIRAFLAAAALGPACALLGVFVTARRMAFFSETVAHGAILGVALGFWLGIQDPTVPVILFSVFIGFCILWLKQNTLLLTDTIMALLLSGSFSLGLIILSLLEGFRAELHSLLFGDVLSMANYEVLLAIIISLVVMGSMLHLITPLSLMTLSTDLAKVRGMNTPLLDVVFVFILTITVAISIRMMGIILVTALLVIPPATARNLSRTLKHQILASLIIGIVSSIGGLWASFQFNTPSGPSVVLLCMLLFMASLGLLLVKRYAASSIHEKPIP